MAQTTAGQVFMSYSRKDEAVMRRVVTFLRNQGINVWVDNEKLVPGTPIWEEEIEKAIVSAGAVVVLLSPDSKKSPWVRREISYAEDNNRRIFPILIAGNEKSAIPIRLANHQRVDIRRNVEVGLKSLSAALSFYLEDLASREQLTREEAQKLEREKDERKALDKVLRKKTIYNFLRAFIVIVIGTILYGGGEWLGYSYSKNIQYTFVTWLPPILGILFGPIVGGATALAGDLMYQVFLPLKSPYHFFINQMSMSSHLLSVVFASLIVRNTNNWKKIIFAGLIILSIPHLISMWSEFSLQFFYREENWEWFNSLKNMLLNVWIIRTLIPNLVVFSLLLHFAPNILNKYSWYREFHTQTQENLPTRSSFRKMVVLMALGWATAFGFTFGLMEFRDVFVSTFYDPRQTIAHRMMMDAFPVDIFLSNGICCGLVYASYFRKKISRFEWYHLATIVLGWMVGMQLSIKSLDPFPCIEVISISEVFYLPAAGFLGGFVSGLPILWTNTNIKLQRVLIIAVGWAIGLFFGFLIPPYPNTCEINQVIRFIISGFLVGGVGALGTVLATWNIKQDYST